MTNMFKIKSFDIKVACIRNPGPSKLYAGTRPAIHVCMYDEYFFFWSFYFAVTWTYVYLHFGRQPHLCVAQHSVCHSHSPIDVTDLLRIYRLPYTLRYASDKECSGAHINTSWHERETLVYCHRESLHKILHLSIMPDRLN